MKRDSKNYLAWLAVALFCLSTVASAQFVLAYDSQVLGDLQYSRNALLRQRSELEEACSRKESQMADLQRDIGRLRAYMQDTDHALRNIDAALREN